MEILKSMVRIDSFPGRLDAKEFITSVKRQLFQADSSFIAWTTFERIKRTSILLELLYIWNKCRTCLSSQKHATLLNSSYSAKS